MGARGREKPWKALSGLCRAYWISRALMPRPFRNMSLHMRYRQFVGDAPYFTYILYAVSSTRVDTDDFLPGNILAFPR